MAEFLRNDTVARQRAEPAPLDSNLLLEIFSPSIAVARAPSRHIGSGSDAHLWAADASHRAKNLAQMCLSLYSPRVRDAYGLCGSGVQHAIAALADAYTGLGETRSQSDLLSCGPILEQIAASLVKLFSNGRAIAAVVSHENVMLPPVQRRALTLIASELVINALKYAFPDRDRGRIDVSLTIQSGIVRLKVSDDGVGLPAATVLGSGSALISRLAALLDARIQCHSTVDGVAGTICELTFAA